MHIVPNNKLSNHFRKKKIKRTVWLEDQTVSGSFRQNMETISEKTKTGVFYEEYLNPSVFFSDNFCPDFYNAYPSILSDDFNGSVMNPYANNGIEGLKDFVGGDMRGLEENNSSGGFVLEHYENGNSIINSMVDVKDANDEYAIEFTDGDGLYDGYDVRDAYGNLINGELSHNCYPLSPDSDRDGMPDGEEVRNGLNPNPQHGLKIPTLLMLPENGGAIYSSMLEQVDLYIFIMTVSGAIPNCPKDKYGSDLLVQGIQEIIVPYNVIYQLKSLNSADPDSIPFVPVDASCYSTQVEVTLPDGSSRKNNVTVITFAVEGSTAKTFVDGLLKYSSASRITDEMGVFVPQAVIDITPDIEATPDSHSIWDDACSAVGEVISVGKGVISAGVEIGKKLINTVADGLKYLAELEKSILETAWNFAVATWNKVVEIIESAWNAFLIWIQNAIKWAFEAIINPIVNAIKGYLASIETAMREFFSELAKWDVVDGDESMSATKEAAIAVMLSFTGMQCYAEPLMNGIGWAMDMIGPFMDYISPMGVIGIIMKAIGETIPDVGNFLDMIQGGIGDAIGSGMSYIVNLLFGDTGILKDLLSVTIDLGVTLPTFTALKNFINAAGLGGNMFINAVLTAFESLDVALIGQCLVAAMALMVSIIVIVWCIVQLITGDVMFSNPIVTLILESLSVIFTIYGLAYNPLFALIGCAATIWFGSLTIIIAPEVFEKFIAAIEAVIAVGGIIIVYSI